MDKDLMDLARWDYLTDEEKDQLRKRSQRKFAAWILLFVGSKIAIYYIIHKSAKKYWKR